MKKYPKEVQNRLDVLKSYKVDENLNEFNCLHLYPKELAYPNGYYDAMFHELWGFNFKLSKKRLISDKADAVFFEDRVTVNRTLIYADGSTFIGFEEPIKIQMIGTAVHFEGCN